MEIQQDPNLVPLGEPVKMQFPPTEPAPPSEVVGKLQEAGVSEDLTASAENVRIATGMEGTLAEEKKIVAANIEEDIQRHEQLKKENTARLAELGQAKTELVTLEENRAVVQSFIEAADTQQGIYQEKLTQALDRVEVAKQTYEDKKREIDQEKQRKIWEAENASIQQRAELRQQVAQRPEFSSIDQIKKDQEAIESLTKAMGDPNLADALNRLQEAGGFSTKPLETRQEESQKALGELTEAWKEEKDRISEMAEAQKQDAEIRAAKQLEVYASEVATAEAWAKVMDSKVQEFAGLKTKYEGELKEVTQQIESTSEKVGNLEDDVVGQEQEIASLGEGVNAQIGMLESLTRAMEANRERLSTRGEQVMGFVRDSLSTLETNFQTKVVGLRDDLATEIQGRRDQITRVREIVDRYYTRDVDAANAKMEEGLLATGLYDRDEQGVVYKKAVRGAEAIKGEYIKRADEEAVIEGCIVATRVIEASRTEAHLELDDDKRKLEEEFERRNNNILDNADLHQTKLNTAIEVVGAMLDSLPEQAPVESSAKFLDSATRFIKKIFGRRQ